MHQGSCLCGAISFSINGDLRSARYCYCSHCTKFAGTCPATWAITKTAKLKLADSGVRISKFNSGGGLRCFCAHCGSPVWFESLDYPEIVAIPLGVLDDDDIPAPKMHIWTRSKPGWCTIHDNLPQHDTNPERQE